MSVEKFRFEAEAPGKNVLVFGAIHGDEQCGPVAIERVMEKIRSGTVSIARGSVTFVPVCNPKAYRERNRVHKENLNRIFKKTTEPDSYEAELANELCTLVDKCDVLLDIHSSFVPAPSNVFVDYPTPENLAFARSLGPDFLVFDWPNVYENNEFSFPGWTTDRYAHEAGKIGILAECGKHNDPKAEELAERYIARTLEHFGLTPLGTPPPIPEPSPRSVYMTDIYRRDSAGDQFTKNWYHLEPVQKGTVIARRANAEEVSAETDCFVIFPKDYAPPGGEWFYLAREDR